MQGTRFQGWRASRAHNTLCALMTGTFEALAIFSTMITQSQKECLDRIQSLCQGVSHFVLQCRAKAMKDHCVNIREKHPPVSHNRTSGYLQAANQSHLQRNTLQRLKLFLPFPLPTSASCTDLHLLPSLLLFPYQDQRCHHCGSNKPHYSRASNPPQLYTHTPRRCSRECKQPLHIARHPIPWYPEERSFGEPEL